MPLRPCLGLPGKACPRLTGAPGSRCPDCQRVVEGAKLRAKRQVRPRASTAEERRRAAVVRAHRAEHGDVCPGWQRPAHPATDLTADHIVSVRASGSEAGPLSVLCRVCNGAKADHDA
jgi:5-methylcytosine-specific restriction protein A